MDSLLLKVILLNNNLILTDWIVNCQRFLMHVHPCPLPLKEREQGDSVTGRTAVSPIKRSFSHEKIVDKSQISIRIDCYWG